MPVHPLRRGVVVVSVSVTVSGGEVSKRWPHIRRFLHVEPSGWVEDTFVWWSGIERTLSPAERAAGNMEWAEFYEFLRKAG